MGIVSLDLSSVWLRTAWASCGALAVGGPSHGQLGAKDFVRMLQEAAAAEGIPENWPDSQLDIASAKLVIELEHTRILAWKGWPCRRRPIAKTIPSNVAQG